MSDAQKPETWGAEAQGLVKRYAVPSGVVMTFLVFASIIVPALMRESRPRLHEGPAQPTALTVGWLDQAEAPAEKGRDLPPVDPATVMSPTPKLLTRGEALFKQNCTSCHGDAGLGNGPAAGTLNPKPRNFTEPAGWTRGYRITDVFETISHGVKGTGMNAFDFIAPADRMALAHYVRSLGKFDHGAEDPKATQALEDQFRSKGVHIPNRIPVSTAIKKMLAEQPAPAPIALPAASDESAAAAALRTAVADPSRVARTVAETKRGQAWQTVAQAWSVGAPSNGFAPAVAGLNDSEWREVITALLGREGVADPNSEGEAKQP
jgi:mono/diheme cytochrome c family protein